MSVNDSTGIVIENSDLGADVDDAVAVDVTGVSSVTVERSELGATTTDSEALVLGPGSSEVVADNLIAQSGTAIEADGTVAGTDIVSNTIGFACGAGVEGHRERRAGGRREQPDRQIRVLRLTWRSAGM